MYKQHDIVQDMDKMPRYQKTLIIGVLSIVACAIFSIRAPEHVSAVRTPDATHIHQVFRDYPLTEEFTTTSRGLSALGLFTISFNPEARVHIIVKEVSSNHIISEQDIPLQNLLHIPLPRQAFSITKRYSVTISAPDTDKVHAIKVAYQSDATLDPTSTVTQAGIAKQGSLGLIQYEKPTMGLQFFRWLALPHQRSLWIGLLVCMGGYSLYKKIRIQQILKPETRIKTKPIFFIVIILASVAMYWPATRLFFYSDDVPILARVFTLWQQQPLLLLTPHRYIDPDPQSQFGFDFYRPVSFSIYPLFLHLLFPPNASFYYLFNILIFAGIACCLFEIATRIINSPSAALLLVVLWISHSSKLGLLYWWSSVQDLLASLFTMLSIVLYFRWKDSNQKNILGLSVASFSLALFSKEYIIVTPIIIASIELVKNGFTKRTFQATLKHIAPYIIAAGAFLVINTAMLGDPTLPAHKDTDQTYALSANPITIIRNSIVYSSFTAEQRLWPQNSFTKPIEQKLSGSLELWRLKTAGPYYPGVLLFFIAALFLLLCWRNTQVRHNLVIGYVWWLLFIAPFLLFTNDWRARWLTLAIFGSSLAIVGILQSIIPKKLGALWYMLACIVFLYGYTTARDPNLTRFFREQAAYTHEAYTQLKTQEAHITDEKRIILVGITADQQTSLNAYLFRLYAKNPNADIIYTDVPPTRVEQGDIVITMTGIIPYYPESEK